MQNTFFAYISRMRYIQRWGLMRSSCPENIQEHSHMVAVLAHALAVIRRDIFGQPADPNAAAAAALFHDASEIFTGDLPTPVKYNNPDIMSAYKAVESLSAERLLSTLPEQLRGAYAPLLHEEESETQELVKAADKLSAYVKCLEELSAGNEEFRLAERQIRETLEKSRLPELQYFMEHFLPSFGLTLDELE